MLVASVASRAAVALRPDARAAVERVDLQPGVVGQRGQARQAGRTNRALSAAFASNVSPVSSTSPADADVVERDELSAGQGEQLAQLAELVDGTRRDDEPAGPSDVRVDAPASHRLEDQRRTVAIASAWAANSRRSPSSARSMSRFASPRDERLALGGPLELDVRAGVRADDVEVDLGAESSE